MNLWQPSIANCAIWAVVQYRRFKREYGERRVTIQCQRSRFVKLPLVPHFHVGLIGEDHRVTFWSYNPVSARARWLAPPLFRGYVAKVEL